LRIRKIKNEIYKEAKDFLIKSSEIILRLNGYTDNEINIGKLTSNDFEPNSIEKYLSSSELVQNRYRIFFDDDINFEILKKSQEKVQKWISGMDAKNSFLELEKILEERERIFKINTIITGENGLVTNQTIDLSKYRIEGEDFYVFDKDTREKINEDIKAIDAIVKNGKQKDKPICVFLAGSPGTGKSYFVKCFVKKMGADNNYPVTSLSGVAADKFFTAINMHIKKAFDQNCKGGNYSNYCIS
jgi:nucleoside-triphosphatase THEP1